MAQSNLLSWLRKSEGKQTNVLEDNSSLNAYREASARSTVPASNELQAGATFPAIVISGQHSQPAAKSESLKSALRPLPASASIEMCSRERLKAFQRITGLLLPISYPESFFRETMDDPTIAALTRLIVWRETGPGIVTQSPHLLNSSSKESRVVAAVRCRLLAHPPNNPSDMRPVLYISVLETLSPFRSLGLASHLLQTVSTVAAREYSAHSIMAHVWEANEDAIAWYKKRGFRVISKDPDYYRRLAPRTAGLLICKDFRPSELVAWPQNDGQEFPAASGC